MSTTPNLDPGATIPKPRGPARMLELWRLFRAERENPGPFYRRLAVDLVADLGRRWGGLQGQRVVDLGAGPGYYTEALVRAGAIAIGVEADTTELLRAGAPPDPAVIADASQLAVRSESLDGVLCSNMLEHAADPQAVIGEIARVLRPGGWGYISFTNWYSPWGGHEMSPYHLLGPRVGPRLYEWRHGKEHKHRVGENLFPLHVSQVLQFLAAHDDLQVSSIEPRYWPWASFVSHVPGVRELVMWNCVIHLSRFS